MDQIKTGKYIISLIKALFTDTKPPEKPEDITFQDIYYMAKRHHIRNMCFYAADQLKAKPEEALYTEWKNHVNVSSAQSAVQMAERDIILKTLQKEEIDCLPLKGCFLKEMYPKNEYREMADLDILIRKESQQRIREIMEGLGYHTKQFDATVHDVYARPPFMDVEMHLALFAKERINRLKINQLKLAQDPWSCALQTELPFVYSFSPEDTYIFLMLHLIKHFSSSGVGIRQFTDIWVYRQKYKLDQDYIYNAFKDTNVLQFCKDTENLVDAWFGSGEMTEDLEEMQKYIFSSGVYGTLSNSISNNLTRMDGENKKTSAEFRYLVNRTFPSLKTMKMLYPFLKKYPVLLPFTWVYRLTVKTFSKDSPALRELRVFGQVRKKRKGK